jgi:hypothetical protein
MTRKTVLKAAAAAFLVLVAASIAFVLAVLYTAPDGDPDAAAEPWTEHAQELEPGDLVFRMGTVTDSRIIAKVSGSSYSHVGMVIMTWPEILVAHATTSDHDYDADEASITTLKDFWSRGLADAGAAGRISGLSHEQVDAVIRELVADKGRAFVLAPRAKPHFYCSTMLYEAVHRQDPSFTLRWMDLSYPGFKGEYLFPQSFIESPRVKKLFAFTRGGK